MNDEKYNKRLHNCSCAQRQTIVRSTHWANRNGSTNEAYSRHVKKNHASHHTSRCFPCLSLDPPARGNKRDIILHVLHVLHRTSPYFEIAIEVLEVALIPPCPPGIQVTHLPDLKKMSCRCSIRTSMTSFSICIQP